MRTRQFSKQTGLSVPETMLVLMLASWLTLQAAPPFSAWLERLSLTATTQKVVTLLRYAQQLAISRHASVSVNLSPGESWCLALSDEPICDCSAANDCQIAGLTYRLSHSRQPLSLSSNRFTQQTPATFDGHAGSSFDSAGTIKLSGANAAAKIIISPLGRVRACAELGALNGLAKC